MKTHRNFQVLIGGEFTDDEEQNHHHHDLEARVEWALTST